MGNPKNFYTRGVGMVIHGTRKGIKQPRAVDFDPDRGLIIHETFEGAGPGLDDIASLYYGNRVAFRWEVGGIKSRITASYSGGQGSLPDEPIANWQLVPNEVHISVLKSQYVRDLDEEFPGSGDPSDEESFPGFIEAVKSAYAAFEKGDSDTIKNLRLLLPDDAKAPFDKVLGWLVRGETHFSLSQPVLRRTYSVSNFFTGDLGGNGGHNSLLTMGSVLSLPMPNVIRAQVSSIPVPTNTHTGYAWSWLQKSNQVVTGAQNRSEVSTEYWWDEWNTVHYGTPS